MSAQTRVHTLAKEIGVTSKAIIEKCQAEGLDVKNHMTALSAGLEATIREWFSEGEHATTQESAERVNLKAVRARPRRKLSANRAEEGEGAGGVATEAAPADEEISGEPVAGSAAAEAPAAVESESREERPVSRPSVGPTAVPPTLEEAPAAPETAPAEPARSHEPPAVAAEAPGELEADTGPRPAPAGPQNIPAPAQLRGPRVIRVERADPVSAPPSRGPGGFVRRGPTLPDIEPPPTATGPGARKVRGQGTVVDDDAAAKAKKARANPRRSLRGSDLQAGELMKEWRERDLIERRERMDAASGRGIQARRAAVARGAASFRPSAPGAKTACRLAEPIILREFCTETGIGMARLMPKLIGTYQLQPSITMVLPKEIAEELALEFGITLEVIKRKTAMEKLRDEFEEHERNNLQPRGPVVTFLGHVDHGKTSLLDAIRKTRVAAGEAGGITQHIGAYRLDRGGLSVTFLDTPGHAAFTEMRARGAQMTDVVVLVVAADDGVMPQTVEAINHAKAAQVTIVVALNKTDLPGADANRVLGQLAEHGLVAQEWGGEIDVIRTAATTGVGIDTLVEHLGMLSELLDLKADPTVAGSGAVIESEMKEGRGSVVRVLVQEGTLRPGTILVCGPGYGRVRALIDDRGQRLESAGPSTPVEVLGLDELPAAGDRFYQVESLAEAKAIVEEIRVEMREKSLAATRKPKSLEEMFRERKEGQIPELKVIIRADMQGSLDALHKSLGEIPSDEVKLQVLHAAVGAITEGDVVLAAASEAIIIGFNVAPESVAERMAKDRGVDVRVYRVIYDLIDDIRKALEGLLEPDRSEETRGKADVRNVFKISRLGTVAGCFVTDGVIARSHKVRLIREGRIILPSEEDLKRGRHREIDSLKRFKDDAREVRNGLECGIRIAGYDDVKEGDVIEAYEVIETARKLS